MEKEKKTEMAFPEAPASWNVRIISPQGFACMLTLRCTSGMKLLSKADAALSYLVEQGYCPDTGNRRSVKMCPIHGCEMKQREKDGKTWYSHQTEDGSWCYGKPSKNGGNHD